jgi:hypothetical protein
MRAPSASKKKRSSSFPRTIGVNEPATVSVRLARPCAWAIVVGRPSCTSGPLASTCQEAPRFVALVTTQSSSSKSGSSWRSDRRRFQSAANDGFRAFGLAILAPP